MTWEQWIDKCIRTVVRMRNSYQLNHLTQIRQKKGRRRYCTVLDWLDEGYRAPYMKRVATINGETKTLKEWARELGIKEATVRQRLIYGWRLEDAIAKPVETKFAKKKSTAARTT